MGNNLLSVLLATAKAKITPIVSKIRLWTSWNFIRTRIIAGIRNFFSSILNIKPRHKRDYYEVFGWLISRRLIFAAMVVLGLVSAFYLFSLRQSFLVEKVGSGIPTYSYDSVLLRFTKGRVRIKGESGYMAYEGNVDKGRVNGFGTLYTPEGDVVYQGNFENNQYQGNGISYYPGGIQTYVGSFEQNEYHGKGKLYRENGSLFYDGDFVRGVREGYGKLYDHGNNLIYQGSFQGNEILYSELLGKDVAQIGEYYTGTRQVYEAQEELVVEMENIDAMYLAKSDRESLDDANRIQKILVLKDFLSYGNNSYSSIGDLEQFFEQKVYEGNSSVTLAEAIAINKGADITDSPIQKVSLKTEETFRDYCLVEDFDEDYIVAVSSYYKDGLIYTFVKDGDEQGFLFYTIEAEEEDAKW